MTTVTMNDDKKITIEQIGEIINENVKTEKDLMSINRFVIDAINRKRSEVAAVNAMKFSVGDEIKFNSSKQGRVVIATIKKINRKSANVIETSSGSVWRVGLDMLESV